MPSLENRSTYVRKETFWMDIRVCTSSLLAIVTNHKYKHLIIKPQTSSLNTFKKNWCTSGATSYASHKSIQTWYSHFQGTFQIPVSSLWSQIYQASPVLTHSTKQHHFKSTPTGAPTSADISLSYNFGGILLQYVGIYCPLIPNWIKLTQAQILFSCQIQNGDTEPNSKY